MRLLGQLLLFLCALLLTTERQAHAAYAVSNHFQQELSLKKSFIGHATKVEFNSSQPGQTPTDVDSLVAAEDDDDDEQEMVGKQTIVVKPTTVLKTICALPPPQSTLVKTITSSHLPFSICPCRYLAHRALLI